MKVVAKRIEMIAYWGEDGNIKPIRFRFKEDEVYQVIKINRIIMTEIENLCGNKMRLYTCSAVINNIEKIFEIKYDIEKCLWFLFRI